MPDTGKNAIKTYESVNGTAVDYEITFPYLHRDHLSVYNEVPPTAPTSKLSYGDLNDYVFSGTISADYPEGTHVRFNTAPAAGNTVTILRDTPSDSLYETFTDGAPVPGAKLNRALKQGLYFTEEVEDDT